MHTLELKVNSFNVDVSDVVECQSHDLALGVGSAVEPDGWGLSTHVHGVTRALSDFNLGNVVLRNSKGGESEGGRWNSGIGEEEMS